jgi:hypothetical protein
MPRAMGAVRSIWSRSGRAGHRLCPNPFGQSISYERRARLSGERGWFGSLTAPISPVSRVMADLFITSVATGAGDGSKARGSFGKTYIQHK